MAFGYSKRHLQSIELLTLSISRIYSSSDKLSKFLQSLGPYSPAVFVLLQVLQVIAAPIPGELTGVAGGYVYGETFGFILSSVGLTLGSWVAFELASILGRPFVERFVSQEVLHKFDFLTTNTGATFSCIQERNVPSTRADVPPSVAPLLLLPAIPFSISSIHTTHGAMASAV